MTVGPMAGPGGSSKRGVHRLTTAHHCGREWYLGYVKNLSLIKERRQRRMGSMVHAALAYYRASKMATPYDWYYDQDLRGHLLDICEGVEADVDLTMRILNIYMQFTASEEADVLHVEEEFSVKLAQLPGETPSWIYAMCEALLKSLPATGDEEVASLRHRLENFDEEVVTARPDLIMRKRVSGKTYIHDYKTRGVSDWRTKRLPTWNPRGEFWLDAQVMHNLHVVRASGMQIEGFIIERIKREDPIDFAANLVDVSPIAYRNFTAFMRECVADELRLMTLVLTGLPTPQNWSACFGRRWPCDFREHCASGGEAEAKLYEARR
jgi:hypothetical protein